MQQNEIVYSPVINTQCNGCNKCTVKCRQNVLELTREMEHPIARVKHPEYCKGCEKCVHICPMNAIRIITTEVIHPLNHKKTMRHFNFKTHFVHLIAFLLIFIGGVAAIVMLLWNALLPDIMGWTTLNYWQALGLFILCHLLFRGTWPPHWKHQGHDVFHRRHAEFHEKMKDMS